MDIPKDAKLFHVSVIIFLLWAKTETLAQDQHFKYNCFKDTNEGTCEESRVKICGDFYVCDLAVKLDHPPKRIGYRNGDVLFSSGGTTYGIGNGSELAEKVNKVIPPLGELFDKKGNTYFGGDGTTYVAEGGTGKEIEIITTGSYSYNQHALDTEGNKLFVLSFDSDSPSIDRTGQIYAVTTDPLNIVNDKIQAELVSAAGNRITALAVQGGLDVLLLGIKGNDGGKLIRLKRQPYDPCSQKETNKIAFLKLIREMEVKIIEIFDTSSESMTRSNLLNETIAKELTTISRENKRLKIELSLTTEKLQSFAKTLLGFPNPFRRPLRPSQLPATSPPAQYPYQPELQPFAPRPSTTYRPTSTKEPCHCLPTDDVEKTYLRHEINELKEREKVSQQKFDALLEQLRGFVVV